LGERKTGENAFKDRFGGKGVGGREEAERGKG